ncbi:MAG TPA: hypothetical protein VG276_14245 [Actinomycetes bacterium]|nr:hypothetical protein [Actinomycetes bacterium]
MAAGPDAGPERCLLAELAAGAEGTIVELRFAPHHRPAPESPLRRGAAVYVVEASGGGWLHVRINFREYSVPPGVADRVVVAVKQRPAPRAAGPETAGAAYAVLLSRAGRTAWRVRLVHRDDGAVVLSEPFDSEADARRRLDELRRDAAALDAAAFRSRHGLP